MRHNFAVASLVVVLLVLVMLPTGCDQPGKTAAEVNREHLRMLRINQQEMVRDVDRALGVDQPSKLTDKQMP